MEMLERIFCSVEYRWRVQQAKSYGVFWLLVTVVIMVFMLGRGAGDNMVAALLTGGILSAVFGVVFAILVAKSLGQNKKLLKNYDRYELYSVQLDTPVVSKSYRRFAYFVLRFNDREGTQIICQTNPIFGLADTQLFPLREYRDKTVDVLYDPRRNKAYVLGISEEE
ncbi:MAG: hypothetical protein E7448_02270 [Ruminococcaceae bacterium]|nr:hypothetical protein [Oscillospiraceae bacterium]